MVIGGWLLKKVTRLFQFLSTFPITRGICGRHQPRCHASSSFEDGGQGARCPDPSESIETLCKGAALVYEIIKGSRTDPLCPPQIVDSVVTLNPSYLAKSSTAGTYCKMAIHPQSRAELHDAVQTDENQEHKAFERVRVDVIRI